MHKQWCSMAAVLWVMWLLAAPLCAQNQHHAEHDPLAWTADYSLIVTNAAHQGEAEELVDLINSSGGQVAVVISPRLLLGWAPATLITQERAAGRARIVSIHRKPVAPGLLKRAGADETQALNFFNQIASGQWRSKKAAVQPGRRFSHPDAKPNPRKVSPAGAPTVGGVPAASAVPGNSEIMAGKVRYVEIFVESNGPVCGASGCVGDADVYTWSCGDVATVASEIAAGLSFWSSKALTYGVPLTFYPLIFRPPQCSGGNPKVLTKYEPILHSSGDDYLWINQIMCNFGKCSGDKFTRSDGFNAARRNVSPPTNWAVTAFIGYNPGSAPTTFSDSYSAYAYIGGPYTQMLLRNNGWAVSDLDFVAGHETAHLFGAFDEYSGSCSDCDSGDAFSNHTVNGNCVSCNAESVSCIMRENSTSLCGYTPGALGWGLNITRTFAANAELKEKTNWVPGDPVVYASLIQVPSLKPGTCLDVTARLFRQFHDGVTEAEGPISLPCSVDAAGAWYVYAYDLSIPAAAEFGEAMVEMQLDVRVAGSACPIGECRYARGVRANNRGRFFVLGASANPIATAPAGTAPRFAVRKAE